MSYNVCYNGLQQPLCCLLIFSSTSFFIENKWVCSIYPVVSMFLYVGCKARFCCKSTHLCYGVKLIIAGILWRKTFVFNINNFWCMGTEVSLTRPTQPWIINLLLLRKNMCLSKTEQRFVTNYCIYSSAYTVLLKIRPFNLAKAPT